MKPNHTYILGLDDFSPKNTNMGLLERLKERYPDFKVTVFTIPWETRFGEATPITLEKFLPFCRAMKKAADWIEVALHGLTHVPGEFKDLTYTEAQKRILTGEKMLINRGIPYAKLFKAPYWQLSPQAKRAAEDLGFKVVEDGYYSWNIKDPHPKNGAVNGVITAHGHVQDTQGNGLEESFMRLTTIPSGSRFSFLSDYYTAEKVSPEHMYQGDQMDRIRVTIDGKEL